MSIKKKVMHVEKKNSSNYRYTGRYSKLSTVISERDLGIKLEMFQKKHQPSAQ